jgi:sterol desaturase/sphingolipid hydroxylase (fatty acid hydroxylase superfamily)
MRSVLPWLVWWVVMASFMALTIWLAGGEMPSPELVFAMTVVNTVFMGVVEQLMPRRSDANLLRDPQTLRDLAHGMSLAFFARPLAAGSSLAVVAWVSPHFRSAAVWPSQAPMVLQVLLVLLIWSFINYWLHRAFHAYRPLWRFHAIHHDTTGQLHLLKAGRVHFGEELIRYFLVPTPLLLIGIPGEALIWMGLWNLYEGNLAHSNLDQRMPRFAHRLFNTLQVHYLHHGARFDHQRSNYSGITPIWDQLFGTFLHPDDNPVEAVGLGNQELPSTLVGQVLHPFRRA